MLLQSIPGNVKQACTCRCLLFPKRKYVFEICTVRLCSPLSSINPISNKNIMIIFSQAFSQQGIWVCCGQPDFLEIYGNFTKAINLNCIEEQISGIATFQFLFSVLIFVHHISYRLTTGWLRS